MKLWTADVGRFWRWAVAALILVAVVGLNCHTMIRPARLYLSDLFILPPLFACIVISVAHGRKIDLLTRFTFGLFQVIVLLGVYSNHWDPCSCEPFGVLGEWVLLTAGYTLLFGVVTHALARRFVRPSLLQLTCDKCGYSLRGLTEARCPECGTSFDPAILDLNAPEGSEGLDGKRGGGGTGR